MFLLHQRIDYAAQYALKHNTLDLVNAPLGSNNFLNRFSTGTGADSVVLGKTELQHSNVDRSGPLTVSVTRLIDRNMCKIS